MKNLFLTAALSCSLSMSGCNNSEPTKTPVEAKAEAPMPVSTGLQWLDDAAKARANIYVSVDLVGDLSHLSDNQKNMLSLLIDASKIMGDLFWLQSYGEPEKLLSQLSDPKARWFAAVNYGPWDRLNGDKPLFTGISAKPLGAQFYPADMTKKEFEALDLPGKDGQYSIIKRDKKGKLYLTPFHVEYQQQLEKAASILRQAAKLAEHKGFAEYLVMRANALTSDDYQPSDLAWMDIKTNPIELVIGPIENYEDQLFGYRSAYEAYVLIKDMAWSEKLARYASFLPELQRGLPVPETYKAETPGTDSDLNAYEVIFYAGHSNAGSKTIAINLPNDEAVQLQKGTRRLQLKNAMRAKFDKIMLPIADVLIAPEQRKHVTFNAFFTNTMFHEVAHGLGIKNTLTNKGTVHQALQDADAAFEEGKADVLGLYMVSELFKKGELKQGEMLDYYTTFLAGIFRSVRFGASSAHGKANMIRFNYFQDKGAFSYNKDSGFYSVNPKKFQLAMTDLSHDLLTIQGDGDYAKAKTWLNVKGVISDHLQQDLNRLSKAGIPVDVVFNQGKKVLGLE